MENRVARINSFRGKIEHKNFKIVVIDAERTEKLMRFFTWKEDYPYNFNYVRFKEVKEDKRLKILIVRHGDPDYSIDSLTEKGWREAKYLSEKLEKMQIDEFFVSPLGRAKDTASFTLKKYKKEATECDWLHEFQSKIRRPDRNGGKIISWDWLPQDWNKEPLFFDKDRWFEPEVMAESTVKEEYDWVTQNFDKVLEKNGYKREGNYYRVVEPNRKVLCFVCHFGLGSVLLSHLLNISPMQVWHGFCAAPSSVTTLTTEERRKGIAAFRMSSFGDISHLYANDEEPAFAARFCEVYDCDERHD